MDNIRAVIFDLDNTLINRKEAFKNFCTGFIKNHFSEAEMPDTFDNMIKSMAIMDKNGYRDRLDFYNDLIKKWGQLGKTAKQLAEEHVSGFFRYTTPDEDMETVLDYLSSRYKLGIISNGSSISQNSKIDFLHLRNRFDSIIVSGDVGVEKPDKGIFELSCRELCVDVNQAVYVGDYYDYDIIGAVNAGLHAIWYIKGNDNNHSYKHTIRRLTELIDLL